MGPTQSNRMILHIPAEWNPETNPSASQIRPGKMIEAFRSMGWEVTLVAGTPAERKHQIRAINTRVDAGENFRFCYIESSTMPTLLTSRHHLPLHPFLDYCFWKRLKKGGTPCGLFYRDIYWKFPEYARANGFGKSAFARFFYQLDLLVFSRIIKKLFVPSLKMTQHLPTSLGKISASLPPGCETRSSMAQEFSGGPLKILYVGGIGVHYGLESSLRESLAINEVQITLCCRQREWDASDLKLKFVDNPKLKVVHSSGSELESLYNSHHLFLMAFEKSSYREFAVPYKLFEASSYAMPIIATSGSEAAAFIEKNHLGFVVGDGAIGKCLSSILENPKILQKFRDSIQDFAKNNSWEKRAAAVIEELEAGRL